MARTDDDTWDLASSVGVTATMVAAARAAATRSEKPLINDPYARPLVEAVGVDMLTRMARGELDLSELDEEQTRGVRRMTDNMAARTKFFDDFLLTATGGRNSAGATGATSAGIRQVVILASGLDARAYRLPWPAGTIVYEVDQPQVIEFKTSTLAGLGVEPTAQRRTVAIDLRYDWPAALRQAGFEPDQPTAWIAEGLLGYLPPDAQDRLLDNITALSTEASRFATESIGGRTDIDEDALKQRMKEASARWRHHGFDLDMTELVYFGDRNEASEYLISHGWETTGRTTTELFAEYGLEPIEATDQPFGDVVYVSAALK
ncbi:MAG: class I SAM-dependent methyltransferase [Mycobacteriaceae bacterium]|nr:class I SAM-dependent methyltransferase [Mycobacteriaceae bacterium]